MCSRRIRCSRSSRPTPSRGNALKSLREMSGAVTNAVWYFAQTRNALPPRDAAARTRAQKRTYAFKQLGHNTPR